MKPVKGASVESASNGDTVKETSFTYNASEQEEISIAQANAKHLFTPEFIPFYPAVQKRYSLTPLETLLYGFLRFYLSNGTGKFYFTNKQLGGLLGAATNSIGNAVSRLRKLGIVKASYKYNSNGGKVRVIHNVLSISIKSLIPPPLNHGINNNNKYKYKGSFKKDVDNTSRPKPRSAEEVLANRHSYMDTKD